MEIPAAQADVVTRPAGVCWSAVFAGLAVGLGTHLLLMLSGAAAALAVFGSGLRPVDNSLLITAAMWNTASMLLGAFVGSYVAARSADPKRTSDGVLHGVVSWGASLLLVAMLAGALGSHALTASFGAAAGTSSQAPQYGQSDLGDLLASLQRGDRDTAMGVLRERLGLSEEQAARTVDQALTVRNSREARNDAAQAGAIALAWLSGAALLSLAAAALGGGAGVHGLHLGRRPDSFSGPRVSPTIGPAPLPTRTGEPPTAE